MTSSAATKEKRISDTVKPPLNIVIVGHVDHGKSTLIGRLLHDSGELHQSQIDTVMRET